MKKVLSTTNKNLNRNLILFTIFSLLSVSGFSQTGINTTSSLPNASAGLDVDFSNLGLLIPRVALTGTANFAPLASHVAGMLVYNTAVAGDVTPGFYQDNGTKWKVPTFSGNAAGDMQYWNGSAWVVIPAGQPFQFLQINGSGIPAWGGSTLATLTTTAASSITSTTAVSGGNISSDGGSAIILFGICWSTSPNPTTALSTKTIFVSGGIGSFTSNITGLTTGTIYYVRAYATTNAGTAYGNPVSFTTL